MSSNKIGLDFGTSFSTMSFVDPATGKPIVLKNEYGDDKTASVVYFGEQETLTGKAAIRLLQDSRHMNENDQKDILQRSFRSIKRKLRSDIIESLPDGRSLKHSEIVAEMLKHLKSVAEEYHGFNESVTDLMLTCPVLFTKKQREILREAATLAGFTNIELREEPIAAALGYAAITSENIGDNILVYDLGGGTFDLAFVHSDERGIFTTPIEPVGDNACAGDDFDLAIYHYWERQLLEDKEFGFGFTERQGLVDLSILHHARECKEQLSRARTTRFSAHFPEQNLNRTFTLSREEFNHLAEPFVERSLLLVQRMLDKIADLDLTPDTFLLIGGSTRMPIVRERLSQLHADGILPVLPANVMQADVAVALGAVVDMLVHSTLKPEYKLPWWPPFREPNAEQVLRSRVEPLEQTNTDKFTLSRYKSTATILQEIFNTNTPRTKQKPIDAIVFPNDIDDLQAAVDQCKDGKTVVVSKGTHEICEPIRIGKSIKIVGETGNPDDVVLEYEGYGSNEGCCEEDEDALFIIAADWNDSVEISFCSIVGHDLDGISCKSVRDLLFRKCVIKDSWNGVCFQNSCAGTFADCNIYNNKCAGVRSIIDSTTQLSFSECNIFKNGYGVVASDCAGTFSKCSIYDNRDTGIYIARDEGLLSECNIYKNNFGVGIFCDGKATVVDCKIHDNTLVGVEIFEGKGIFKRCKFFANGSGDFHVDKRGTYCRITECTDNCGNPVTK